MSLWFDKIEDEALTVSNIYRVTILALLEKRRQGLSWSQINEIFKESPDNKYHINDNAFRYHLNKLQSKNYVQKEHVNARRRNEDRTRYKITNQGETLLRKYGINDSKVEELLSPLP